MNKFVPRTKPDVLDVVANYCLKVDNQELDRKAPATLPLDKSKLSNFESKQFLCDLRIG